MTLILMTLSSCKKENGLQYTVQYITIYCYIYIICIWIKQGKTESKPTPILNKMSCLLLALAPRNASFVGSPYLEPFVARSLTSLLQGLSLDLLPNQSSTIFYSPLKQPHPPQHLQILALLPIKASSVGPLYLVPSVAWGLTSRSEPCTTSKSTLHHLLHTSKAAPPHAPSIMATTAK